MPSLIFLVQLLLIVLLQVLDFGKLSHLLLVLIGHATCILSLICHIFQNDLLVVLASGFGLFIFLLMNLKLLKLFMHLLCVDLLDV